MEMSDRFAKVLAIVGPVLCLGGFLLQQHHAALEKRTFYKWREELLARDWTRVEREVDSHPLDMQRFQERLSKAVRYSPNRDRTLEEGRFIIFTKSGTVPVKYDVFKCNPETVVIYGDDFGFWVLCPKKEIGLLKGGTKGMCP